MCVQEGRNLTMKVVAKKGSKAIICTIANDREWLSIMTCVKAIGFSIPNLYIFKRKTKPIINYIIIVSQMLQCHGNILEVGLDIFILLAHSTHELQPLDMAKFHPFKLNLAQEKT